MTILVTGGAGFIGSNFIIRWIESGNARVINLDKLAHGGSLENLAEVAGNARHEFVQGDVCDRGLINSLLDRHKPDAVIHFAAESHVDRSIHAPDDFVRTNVNGTFSLLEETRAYWTKLAGAAKGSFRFLHISTDEVYGSLGSDDPGFTETTAYSPASPYSATKAGADHLVRAYHRTYGLPALITNCSNNFGPRQFPEKLVPLTIFNALEGIPIPVYGTGRNIRDWLYVDDHCDALRAVLERGTVGQTYNVGGGNQKTNLEVVNLVCSVLDELVPHSPHKPHAGLISFVKDRPGHDLRYATDYGKIQRELGWTPRETFETGLRKTVKWYLDHGDWLRKVTAGSYRDWIAINYSNRAVT